MKRRTVKASDSSTEDEAVWTSVWTDRVRSKDPSLFFTTEIRLTWRLSGANQPVNRYTAPRLARRQIEEEAERCDVLRPDAAEQDITVAVQRELPLSAEGVEVVAVRLRVRVDDTTRRAALLLEGLRQEYERHEERIRRDHDLDELARRQVRARETFLREEILATPSTARLYGLLEGTSKNWNRLGGPPSGSDLDELVRDIQQWQPGQRWVTAAQLLHEFVVGLSAEGRKELLTLLVDAVRTFGDEQTAHQLALLSDEAR